MSSDVTKTATRAVVTVPPLVNALNQSEQIKDKVEECAQELSSVNDVLKREGTEHLSLEQVKQALHQSEEVEAKALECPDDLWLVNQALAQEVRERKRLERELAESQIKLAAARAELSDTEAPSVASVK